MFQCQIDHMLQNLEQPIASVSDNTDRIDRPKDLSDGSQSLMILNYCPGQLQESCTLEQPN